MLIHVQMSSSAKADDPVRRAVRELSSAGDYWIPAFAGMTTVLGSSHAAKYATRQGCFVSCAFRAAGRMLSATREKSREFECPPRNQFPPATPQPTRPTMS